MNPMNQRNRYAPPSEDHACQRISSFERNPANGGMPAIANVAMNMVQCVMGMRLCRSPMLRMSCSPLMAWITDPDPRNSSALKKACVKTWKTQAENAPTPRGRNIYLSCETVEYASRGLISFCTKPMEAAKIAVTAPMMATVFIELGASTNSALDLATM